MVDAPEPRFPNRLGDELSRRICHIGYVGNSVTAQRNGYRPRLHRKFIEHFGRPHIEIKAGFGAMGSAGCLFTLDAFVLRHRPDICFIECAVGDYGTHQALDLTKAIIEAIIRNLMSAGCWPCVLHLGRNDIEIEKMRPIISCYNVVTDYYRVPSIDLSEAVAEDALNRSIDPALFFTEDGVHQNDRGAELISTRAFEAFLALISSGLTETKDFKQQLARQPIFGADWNAARLIPLHPSMLIKPDMFIAGKLRLVTPYIELDSSNAVCIAEIPCKIVGMMLILGPHSGYISVAIDGDEEKYQTWDLWCAKERLHTLLFKRIAPQGARLVISAIDEPFKHEAAAEYAVTRKQSRKLLKIVGLMAIGPTAGDKTGTALAYD
jgi:hypothetical protein